MRQLTLTPLPCKHLSPPPCEPLAAKPPAAPCGDQVSARENAGLSQPAKAPAGRRERPQQQPFSFFLEESFFLLLLAFLLLFLAVVVVVVVVLAGGTVGSTGATTGTGSTG
eukprot:CAMPEP_0175575794 /NCGR_PEP_ID=MMETSP0096-20121207/44749_1 /TAXON_ID=311494 /ORGANISM="Alexandrium monilatum, Strain CCMP3105" /LENGTH=110 /DNA_ID=CAMNT_0016879335 /DNA_START=297 /DNA_END=626 /DNA_ORIENTATION=+